MWDYNHHLRDDDSKSTRWAFHIDNEYKETKKKKEKKKKKE